MTENIQFANDRERELFARAQLGENARSFLASNVGRYLHGRAIEDLEAAKAGIMDLDPLPWWAFRARRQWRAFKLKALVAESFMKYCVDAIQDGDIAYNELKQQEDQQ